MQRGEEEARRGDSNLQRCANAAEGEAREEGQEAGGIDERAGLKEVLYIISRSRFHVVEGEVRRRRMNGERL